MAITRQRTAEPRGGPAPAGITAVAPRRARRPMVVAVGTILAVVGGLGTYALVNDAGDRVAVLAVAQSVPKGATITAADLVTAQVAPDPALSPVPASDAAQIIGKTAAVDLVQGSLLTAGSVQVGSSLTAGRSVVGILAKPGMIPAGQLQPGDAVTVVSTPGQSGTKPTGAPLTITAVVVSVGAPDANENSIVDLAVNPADGPTLASWASTGQVAVITGGSS
jgi:hypothetical protein